VTLTRFNFIVLLATAVVVAFHADLVHLARSGGRVRLARTTAIMDAKWDKYLFT